MRDADNMVTAWPLLSDAYGEAREVPVLIEQLATSPTPDVWDDLWGHLCHQGTVYPASYAALPLLLALTQSAADKFSALHLIGAIIASEDLVRIDHRPADLIDDIARRARPLIEECMAKDRPDTTTFIYMLQTAAAFDGDLFWGRSLDALADGGLPVICPSCRKELYLEIGRVGFFTTTEWVRNEHRRRTPIAPAEPAALSGRGAWLYETAIRYEQSEVAMWIRHLFGQTQCLHCGAPFDVAPAAHNT